MWSHNSFGNNSLFPNGFNQEDFLYSAGPFSNSSGAKPPFASRPHHDALIDICSSNGQNNPAFITTGFQPEIGLYNQHPYDMDTQSDGLIAPCTPSVVQTANPSPRPSAPQISSRAAELKAQLLARRAGSAISPSGSASGMPGKSVNVNNVTHENPQNSSSTHSSPDVPLNAEKREQEIKLNALISQYSDQKSTAGTTKKKENTSKMPSQLNSQAQLPLPKTSMEVKQTVSEKKDLADKKTANTIQPDVSLGEKEPPKRPKKKGNESDASEGEILEDVQHLNRVPPSVKLNVTQDSLSVSKSDQNVLQKNNVEQTTVNTQNSGPREAPSLSSSKPVNFPAKSERIRNEGLAEAESCQGSKVDSLDCRKQDHSVYTEAHRLPQNVSHVDEYRRLEDKVDPREEQNSKQTTEQEPLSKFSLNLADMLSHDADLREWLEITGYHNEQYRNKILDRRRAIAALDAQREKLLAEIEAEERGRLSASIGNPCQPPSVLPSPVSHAKARCRPEGKCTSNNSSPQIDDRVLMTSNKRPHSNSRDSRTENFPNKNARIEEKNHSLQDKDEEGFDNGHSRLNGHDPSYHHEETDSSRPRIHRTGNSQDRNTSPGFQVYSRKATTRTRGYENDPYDDEDMSETGSRPFESRVNYRGRSFNPNYRGRGRGRGRGDARDRSPEPRGEGSYSTKSGNNKPHKNSRGSGRGDKAGA